MRVPSRRLAGVVVVVITAALGLVAAGVAGATRTAPPDHHGDVSSTVAAARRDATAASIVARLSSAQLAGQRIVYAYAGLTPPSQLLSLIRSGEAAGVIFFSPNIASQAQLRAVIGQLQAANAASPVHAPLLMMTDQEGGLVRRLPGAPQLSEKQIGAAPNASALAAAAGSGAGRNLASTGLNVNLAPVLDVFRSSGNFIDAYERSYSSNPAVVASLGGAFIAAQQRTAVAATAKHFPGLGAAGAAQDTDTGPVTLNVPLSTLRSVDELPYRAAIAAGVKLVMVSWAIYPALDPRLPAGLSSAVIDGELRARLGFGGVTITDGLGAGALNAFGGFATRGVLAARAGADLLLCSTTNAAGNTPANGLAALGGLVAALSAGSLPRAAAQQAAALVIALRLAL